MNLQNQSKNPHAFPNVSQNDKTIAMLIWILTIFTGFIGPLIIWLIKKDESEFINQQGKNYLNYAISYSVYLIISYILTLVLIGFIPLVVLSIAGFVYTIIGIVTVNKGEDFVVPLTFELIK